MRKRGTNLGIMESIAFSKQFGIDLQTISSYAAGEIHRNLGGPLKDVVVVPDGGYTIFRFRAWNPGWWIFHCHIEFHLEVSD